MTVSVIWLVSIVTWVGLHSVIVVFLDHNHIFIEKLAVLLLLSASVLCLFFTMTWTFLQCVIVAFQVIKNYFGEYCIWKFSRGFYFRETSHFGEVS